MGGLFSTETVFTEEGLKDYSANELKKIINAKSDKLTKYKDGCGKKIDKEAKELSLAANIYSKKVSLYGGGKKKRKRRMKASSKKKKGRGVAAKK